MRKIAIVLLILLICITEAGIRNNVDSSKTNIVAEGDIVSIGESTPATVPIENKTAENINSTTSQQESRGSEKPSIEEASPPKNTIPVEEVSPPQETLPARVEEKFDPVELRKPAGKLKLTQIPFVYNNLAKVENIHSTENAIKVLGGFQYLVCSEPGKLTQEEIVVSDAIKDRVKIFGYIYLGGSNPPSFERLMAEIDNVAEKNWYGVFIDQFGYDFGETREMQNKVVDYAHGKGLKCFVNCWFIDDAFANETDSKHNPNGVETHLGEGDWYLIESLLMSNAGYVQDSEKLFEKCIKAAEYKEKLKINVACLSYKRDAASWANSAEDIKNSYVLSLLFGFDGWWFGDRLEKDDFMHGEISDIDFGDSIKNVFERVNGRYFMAETDKYLIRLDMEKFPKVSYKAYPLEAREILLRQLE